MRDANRSKRLTPAAFWLGLNAEQRLAAAGSVLLIVSTIGSFTVFEAIEVVLALGVLYMLRNRARGHRSDMPISDGSAIATAGIISGILILVRMFDRPFGQGLLALICAGIVAFAGIRDHTKRTAADKPAPEAEAQPNPLEGFEEAVEEATAPEPRASAGRLRG
jgi:hypothetical protein